MSKAESEMREMQRKQVHCNYLSLLVCILNKAQCSPTNILVFLLILSSLNLGSQSSKFSFKIYKTNFKAVILALFYFSCKR